MEDLRNPRDSRDEELPGAVRGAWAASIPQDTQRLFAERSAGFRELLNTAQPDAVHFGQVWTTELSVDGEGGHVQDAVVLPRIVVVLVGEAESEQLGFSTVNVAPISVDTTYWSSYDLAVFEEGSPLGYEFMIEVWNEVTMLAAQLGRCLGTLRQPAKRWLGLLYQAHLGTEVDLSELGEHVGPAIQHSMDPRVAFQIQEIEACEYLRRPLLRLIEKQAAAGQGIGRPERGVLLSLTDLPVKYEVPSLQMGLRDTALPLAAASERTESPSHFVSASYSNEEILLILIRDFRARSLCMVWEKLPSDLHGKAARVWMRTAAGESHSIEDRSVHQGAQTCFGKDASVAPSQVKSVSLEFIEEGQESAAT